jgi:hypothetical protein
MKAVCLKRGSCAALSVAQSRSHCASSVMKSVPCSRQHTDMRNQLIDEIGGGLDLVLHAWSMCIHAATAPALS